MVNRTIYEKVLRLTLSSWWCLSFPYEKDFNFTSLALLVLVLLLTFHIRLFVHSGSSIGCRCHCTKNLVEFSNHLWVLGG